MSTPKRNEQICEVTHRTTKDVKWHDERSGTMKAHFFLDESILLSTKSTRYYVLVDRNICIYYTYVGVITPNLVIIIIYNKTKVNIIDILST